MTQKFTSPDSMNDMADIAAWNSNRTAIVSPELIELKDFHTDDKIERTEKSNKLLDDYLKNNLQKIVDSEGGSTIDILELIDVRNKKTSGIP